jgi:Family of unknown function (DUF6049)
VLRPSSLSRALAVVAAAAVAGLGPALADLGGPTAQAAAARPLDPSQPLVLHMHSITPDYIPDHGPIDIHGTITNASDEEWTAINVHGFIGSAPLTTAAELAQAARTPVTADVGNRITTSGTFDTIAKLEPGQSKSFSVHLPRSQLNVSAAGVYWFGVHALGATAEGRTNTAVGRDRTFLPLVPDSDAASGRQEPTALVVPIRAGVVHASDGSIQDPAGWLDSMRSGALHDVVSVGRAAQGRPLTWVVDPAVPDAVRRLAAGNPPRTLASGKAPTPGGPTPSGAPSASGSPTSSGTAATSAPSATVRVAKRWLHHVHHQLAAGTGQILGLPYGDLAVDSAARYDRPLLGASFRRTGHTLNPWGLPLGSAVAPPDDRMAASSFTALPHDTTVLLDDGAVTGRTGPVNRVNGRRLVLTSSGAVAGGPGPVDPLSPLALRQRILSEAALRFLDHQQPLVVQLPTHLRHPIGPGFFTGLDVPWMRLTTLEGATVGPVTRLSGTRLRPPATDQPQLGPRLYTEANQALDQGSVLQSVLTGNTVLRRRLFEETTGNASYTAAQDPYGALARMRSTSDWVNRNLSGITLSAPETVTLASASGRFSALVSNDLDVPVTVKVRAVADSHLRITGGETVQLPPHGRTTVLLTATTHVLGVHNVTLELTDQNGKLLGSTDRFPMRAEQVSQLIWVIIGVGVGLLFATIVIRLVRRILRSRAS